MHLEKAFLLLSLYDIAFINSFDSAYVMILAMTSVSSDIIGTFHTILPLISLLISVSCDIIALWYPNFHDILALIMAPARQNGAGCGRYAPGAPPPARAWDGCSAEQRLS